jgi:hypothetical protein
MVNVKIVDATLYSGAINTAGNLVVWTNYNALSKGSKNDTIVTDILCRDLSIVLLE